VTTIETARLKLRMPVAADADDYFRLIHSDPDVMRYLPGGVPRSRDQTAVTLTLVIEHWYRHGFGLWAAELKDTAGMIGHCGLAAVEAGESVEVAFAFGKAFWRKGFASEAARASLRFGFEHLNLSEIVAVCVPANIWSQHVMEAIGMQKEGLTCQFYGAELMLYRLKRDNFHVGTEPYRLQRQAH
jgi:RimJ/RimL family protein N-acetyltransferase